MLDAVQIFFIFVVSILTILLVVVGIEVFKLIKEARKTLNKTNKVLDDAQVISTSIATPVEKLSGLIEGLQHGVGVVNFISRLIEKQQSNNGENQR